MTARDGPAPHVPVVATVGRASVRAAPDAARLSLELWAELDTPEAALDEVARRTEALQKFLDEEGVTPAARSTSGVSLSEQWDHQRDERVFRGYRAGTRVSLRITELGMLGRVISGAARRAQARPEGPGWVVDPDNPARVEACRLAAEDCRRKAEAYAEALGLALGRVRSIREPGAGGGPRPRQGALFLAAASAVDEVEMPIEAGEVEVRAVVHVVFELAEPTA